MQPADTILIQGLEFYGFHGVSAAEQTVGHRYSVDVALTVDTRLAATSDDVADTIDYSAVAACIVQIGAGMQFRLLEALAGHLTQQILAQFPRVETVRMRVHKILPPLNVVVSAVGVEITRTRMQQEATGAIQNVVLSE